MAWTNKLMLLALILFAINYLTGGFVFQQLGSVGDKANPYVEQYGGDILCATGVYITYPLLLGFIPIPGVDDIMVVSIVGLFILGVLSAMNKPIKKKWKIAIFLLIWLTYRFLAWLLVVTTPGCSEKADFYGEALSPLLPLFLIIGIIYLVKKYFVKKT
jgi:hypothetical protein